MRQKGVDSCRWLGVVCLAFCFLAAVPAVATESTITSSGSGFIVTSDGYILTNEHVVGDSETVTVFVEGTGYPATVVTKSAEGDLALLKIAASGLTPVALGNSLQVQLLDDVVALGYPLPQFGRDLTVSEGRITSFRTNVEGREGRDTLQHDAVITHGSSGGPLFNLRGEVIGVNFAGVEGSGMQLAIPINETVPLLRSIPSFSPSHMGTAMQILTPQQVAATYTASVVYIEVAVVINWQEVLPDVQAIPGFPEEQVGSASTVRPLFVSSDETSWEEWLALLGFRVVGSAGLNSQQSSGNRYGNSIDLLAFSDAAAAQSALSILLNQYPPRQPQLIAGPPCDFVHTVLSEGSLTIEGVVVSYAFRVSTTGGENCLGSFGGIMVFQLGACSFRVALCWTAPSSKGATRGTSYQGGYLCVGGQRALSAEEVLTKLQELTRLVIVTATNELAGM